MLIQVGGGSHFSFFWNPRRASSGDNHSCGKGEKSENGKQTIGRKKKEKQTIATVSFSQ